MRKITKRSLNLIGEAMHIQDEEVKSAGALGFLAPALVQVTLPHTAQDTLYYKRVNGRLSLAVRAHESYGVPYGTIPRMVLAWICTEAVKTKDRELVLGRSASQFAEKMGLTDGGRDLKRLKQQCLALARSVISIDDTSPKGTGYEDIKIAKSGFMLWGDKNYEQPSLWDSTLTLTEDFYEAITDRSVPLDLRIYSALSKSPLSMDIYSWLVYRMFVLRASSHREAHISWEGLKEQFGVGYSDDKLGLKNFRAKFLLRLKEVFLFYPDAADSVEEVNKHIRLRPCKLHIKQSSNHISGF